MEYLEEGRGTGKPLFLGTSHKPLVLCQASFDGLGATAGLPSSAENTVGQANRGTPQFTTDRALATSFMEYRVSCLLGGGHGLRFPLVA